MCLSCFSRVSNSNSRVSNSNSRVSNSNSRVSNSNSGSSNFNSRTSNSRTQLPTSNVEPPPYSFINPNQFKSFNCEIVFNSVNSMGMELGLTVTVLNDSYKYTMDEEGLSKLVSYIKLNILDHNYDLKYADFIRNQDVEDAFNLLNKTLVSEGFKEKNRQLAVKHTTNELISISTARLVKNYGYLYS